MRVEGTSYQNPSSLPATLPQELKDLGKMRIADPARCATSSWEARKKKNIATGETLNRLECRSKAMQCTQGGAPHPPSPPLHLLLPQARRRTRRVRRSGLYHRR